MAYSTSTSFAGTKKICIIVCEVPYLFLLLFVKHKVMIVSRIFCCCFITLWESAFNRGPK